jgi:hydroxymethylbilane synthase
MTALRIGSRGSELALWQAHHIQAALRQLGADATVTVIHTTGDRILDAPLARFGGKGLFTKEIEDALLAGAIDVAVHSLKDVPSQLPPGLVLGAILAREDPRDALVAGNGITLATLPDDAHIGTSSLRRQAQLLALHPRLRISPLRGNLDTRLRKFSAGEYDALLLACSGLKRLQRTEWIREWIPPDVLLPAVGQGALALEIRTGDAATRARIAPLHHAPTAAAVSAERALLLRLEAGCQAPVAAFAEFNDASPTAGEADAITTGSAREKANERADKRASLHLRALVASPDGRTMLRAEAGSDAGDAAGLDGATGSEWAVALGRRVADMLLDNGAGAVLTAAAGVFPMPQTP